MADPKETLRLAVEGLTSLYENGDAAVIINSVFFDDHDDVTSIGVVSALALLAAGAMRELEQVTGDAEAGVAWLRREALKFQ